MTTSPSPGRKVPSIGPDTARFAFIGEAPGGEEERSGIPFIGTSGSLLTSILANAGIRREQEFITNVCKYRPPGNDITNFLINKSRLVPNKLIAEGMAELYVDLARVDPAVIVPLGNIALWAVTGIQKPKITRRRGSILPCRITTRHVEILDSYGFLSGEVANALPRVFGKKVIPTIHPAAVLREYKLLVFLKTDLKRIIEEAAFPELRLPVRTHHIDPPADELAELMEKLLASELMAVDLECPGNQLYCYGFSCDPSWSLVLRMNNEMNLAAAKVLLESPVPKVAQNGIFDYVFSKQRKNWVIKNLIHDTMIGQHVAYAELPKGLDTICSIYTREPYYKDEGKHSPIKIAENELQYLEYNGKDCCVTLEAMQAMLKNELSAPAVWLYYDHIVRRQQPIYCLMNEHGILVDQEERKRLLKQYRDEAAELQRQLDRHVIELLMHTANKQPARATELHKFVQDMVPGLDTEQGGLNVNSNPMMHKFLYKIMGYKEKKKKKAGGYTATTADEDAIRELYAETGDVILLTIIHIRQKRKRISTYLRVRTDGKDYTYYAMGVVGPETGRSRCGKTVDKFGQNMQTWPHELRRMFRAEPGYILANFDLSQAEARLVAYRGGITRMIQAFENGEDVHKITASNAFGLPLEAIEEYPHRYLGKRSNHAFNYDMGWEKFWRIIARDEQATGVRISRKQAKEFRLKHFQLYPELRYYWADIASEIKATSRLKNPWGFVRIFFGRKDEETFREGYSHWAQSTVAGLIRRGMVRVYNEVIQPLELGYPHTRILLEMHDSLLIQLPEELLPKLAPRIKDCMTIPIPHGDREIIIPVDSAAGLHWEGSDWKKHKVAA